MRRTESLQLRHIAQTAVVTAAPDTTLADCARRMRDEHVGCVVIVEGRRPTGVITDRDIVVEAVAQGIAPATLRARDLVAAPLATARDDDDLIDALARMREHGVRRLVVLDRDGALAGIVALDDIHAVLAEQFAAAMEVHLAARTRERTLRPSLTRR